MADKVITAATFLPDPCSGCIDQQAAHHPLCVTKLISPKDRIAACAHLCRCHDSYDLFTAPWKARILGFTPFEFDAGRAMYRAEEEEHYQWCQRYGHPEYGGWNTSPKDGRSKPQQVIEKEMQS